MIDTYLANSSHSLTQYTLNWGQNQMFVSNRMISLADLTCIYDGRHI